MGVWLTMQGLVIKSRPIILLHLKQATQWLDLFLSLGGEVTGFTKSSITPYIHILVYHVPKFLKGENSLKSLTGQGVEKTNDIVRSIYRNKATDMMPARKLY